VFRTVLDDDGVSDPASITRILACTGKIYYELLAAHEARGGPLAGNFAIVRFEQLYPFPQTEFAEILRRYPAAQHVVWVQEEPRNMGAWSSIRGRIQPMLGPHQAIGYAGRPRSASPAPGSPKVHQREQTHLIEAAFAAPSVARFGRKRLVRRKKER
jgi:2-oxoglutarate dehydrogenase complex dehydrogenase (E1) component-like enzyme